LDVRRLFTPVKNTGNITKEGDCCQKKGKPIFRGGVKKGEKKKNKKGGTSTNGWTLSNRVECRKKKKKTEFGLQSF